MSDISISTDTIQSISLDNQFSGAESINDRSAETGSGYNDGGVDTMEQTVAGTQVVSRTEEYFGAGTDFSSTGTDVDIQKTISAALDSSIGSITDKIA